MPFASKFSFKSFGRTYSFPMLPLCTMSKLYPMLTSEASAKTDAYSPDAGGGQELPPLRTLFSSTLSPSGLVVCEEHAISIFSVHMLTCAVGIATG
jgi:hypothetical protein